MRDVILALSLVAYAVFGYFVMKAADRFLDECRREEDEPVTEPENEQAETEKLNWKERIERWAVHCYKHPRLSRLLFHLLNGLGNKS